MTMENRFKKLRIINREPFFVVEVEDVITHEWMIIYTTDPIDEEKEYFDYDDLKPIWL